MPTLNWIGKEKVVKHHHEVDFRALEHRYGFSSKGQQDDPVDSENMIIHEVPYIYNQAIRIFENFKLNK